MAATARRKTTITYSGDVEGEQVLDAASNASSPAMIEQATLTATNNTITVPSGATCCTITKPTDNAIAITLKGVAADTGVRLHDTDTDSISLNAAAASFVLYTPAESPAVVVRIFWS